MITVLISNVIRHAAFRKRPSLSRLRAGTIRIPVCFGLADRREGPASMPTVFLDCDGVLADFDAVRAAFGDVAYALVDPRVRRRS